jgi:hypothetical protein
LTDKEKDVTNLDENVVPVYELNYDPLPQVGYDNNTPEKVVFVSNETLLHSNYSEIEVMKYRIAEADEKTATPMQNTNSEEDNNRPLKKLSGNGLHEIKAVEACLDLAKKSKARTSAMLAIAKANHENALRALNAAKKEDEDAKADLEDAQNALEAVSAKWEVIDVDSDGVESVSG